MSKGGPFFTISQEHPCLFLNISAAQSTPNNKDHNSIIFEQLYRGVPIFTFLLLRDIEKGGHYMKRKYCSYLFLQSWACWCSFDEMTYLKKAWLSHFTWKTVSLSPSDTLGLWVHRLCPWKSIHISHWLQWQWRFLQGTKLVPIPHSTLLSSLFTREGETDCCLFALTVSNIFRVNFTRSAH